jgi:hypothetical protein
VNGEIDISILRLSEMRRNAKIFFNIFTGKCCANFAPCGAVKKLVIEIRSTAGK